MSQSPAEVLEFNLVLTPKQVAWVLQFLCTRGRSKGEPDPRKARDLIRSGGLRLVDPSQPVSRWTVAADEVRRYISEGPRSPRFDDRSVA
jgi:hypothetical protein